MMPTSNYKIILLSWLTFARDVLLSTELFSSQCEKERWLYQQRRRLRELKEIWWGVNKVAAWAGGWAINCKMVVRKSTVCKISLKTVKHQSKRQDIFKAYLSKKLKQHLSQDNKQKCFNHKVQYSCFLRFTSHCFTASGSTLALCQIFDSTLVMKGVKMNFVYFKCLHLDFELLKHDWKQIAWKLQTDFWFYSVATVVFVGGFFVLVFIFWQNINCHSLNRCFFMVYVAALFIRTDKVKQHLSLARLAQKSVTILKTKSIFYLFIHKVFFLRKPQSRTAHHLKTYSFFSLLQNGWHHYVLFSSYLLKYPSIPTSLYLQSLLCGALQVIKYAQVLIQSALFWNQLHIQPILTSGW